MLNNFQCFLGASRTLKLLKFGHNVPLQRFPITFFLFFCVHFSPNTGQVFLNHVYKYYLTNVLNLKTDNLSRTIAATLFHRWESEDKQGKVTCFPSDSKESACNAGDMSSVPGWGRSLGEWQSTPIFLLENSMDRGAWRVTVHGVKNSWTQLSNFHFHFKDHICRREHNISNSRDFLT